MYIIVEINIITSVLLYVIKTVRINNVTASADERESSRLLSVHPDSSSMIISEEIEFQDSDRVCSTESPDPEINYGMPYQFTLKRSIKQSGDKER